MELHLPQICLLCGTIDLLSPASLDVGIVRALWLTPSELQAATAPLRSPLVWQVIADYLSGQQAPLDLVRYVP